MRNLLSTEIVLPQLPSRRVLSIGVIVIILVPVLAIGIGEPGEDHWLVPILVLLFAGIEWFEQFLYRDEVPQKIGVMLLLLRILLAGLAIYINESPLNTLLLSLAVFNAYFVLGAQVSNALAVLYIFISITRADEMSTLLNQSQPIVGWVIQILVLIFLLILARALERDKEQQRYTEKLLADLQISNRELKAYTSKIAELATAEERNRLARDIHDSLGHYLIGVNIQLERARVFHTRDPQQSLIAIQEAKQAAEEALRDVRRSVADLRETDTSFSLEKSISHLLKNLASEELDVDFQFSGDENGYSRLILLTLYRAAQEGLTNIHKHADATSVKLDVSLCDQQALLRLSDDGCGFQPDLREAASTNGIGYGLQGIQERIGLVRGQMTLTSAPQLGTELVITIPKNPLF